MFENYKVYETTIAGRPTIDEVIGHLRFEISPASFFQVNPVQMQRLYDQVRAYVMMGSTGARETSDADAGAPGAPAGAAAEPVLLDLYCGVGSIGLYCADLAKMVVGIESVKEAVADANRNAVINGIVNARYLCGKAEELLPAYVGKTAAGDRAGDDRPGADRAGADRTSAAKKGQSPVKIDPQLQEYIRRADIAILDPPRAGCRPELLEAVADAGAEHIIYVSCDPATLARDVRLLMDMGYKFVEATPVDMFPHTGHVETVVLLRREKVDGFVSIDFGEANVSEKYQGNIR